MHLRTRHFKKNGMKKWKNWSYFEKNQWIFLETEIFFYQKRKMEKIYHSPGATPAKATPTQSANTINAFIFGSNTQKLAKKSLVNQFTDWNTLNCLRLNECVLYTDSARALFHTHFICNRPNPIKSRFHEVINNFNYTAIKSLVEI